MKRVGILGLPQSGKTTLFEILMQGAGHGSAAGREQVGVVRVPDERIDRLAALYHPKKTTYAQIQFVDSGAARGAHAGASVSDGSGAAPSARQAAKGPDLFSSVRNCDALMAVVRDFENPAVAGASDPDRDLRDLEAELVFNDLAIVENRIDKMARELRVGKKEGEREHALLTRCKTLLEEGRALRGERFEPDEEKVLRGFQLLSLKPLLAVYNQDDRTTRVPTVANPAAPPPRRDRRATGPSDRERRPARTPTTPATARAVDCRPRSTTIR